MIYLSSFTFPSMQIQEGFLIAEKHTCYDSFYPFKVLDAGRLEFEPITILYGNNGSGKTTALNVIAECLNLKRDSLYNRSNFFEDYIKRCDYNIVNTLPDVSSVITSDDVFDFMLTLRSVNIDIDEKREELMDDYTSTKYSNFKFRTMDDYEQLKKVNLSRRKSKSQYVRNSLMDNVQENSNGESAFKYFVNKIGENGLFLLDEPENSLSPSKQLELIEHIKDSARFFGCQFIIATHSPFLLSIEGAKIYDLDSKPPVVKNWTELENVKVYYDFFKKNEKNFI